MPEEEVFNLDTIELIDPTETSPITELGKELQDNSGTEAIPTAPVEPKTIELTVDVNDEDVEITPETKPNVSKTDATHFSLLAKALQEEGILSELPEDFAGDASSLLSLLQENQVKSAKSMLDEFLDKLPSKLKKAVSTYADGLDEDEALELADKFDKISSVTAEKLESNIELQKAIYKQNLMRKGFSEDKANKYVQRAEDNDDLYDESLEALNEDKQFIDKEEQLRKEQAKQREIQAIESQRRQLENIKKDVEATEEIVPGLKLNKKAQESLFKSMTEVVSRDQNGNPLNSVMTTRVKNPLAFEKALHYYHQLGLFNIDDKGNFKPDLNKLTAISKTKAISQLEEKIKSEPIKGGRTVDLDDDSDILKAFESHFSNNRRK